MPKAEEMCKSWLRLCKDPRTSPELLENAAYWESINQSKEYSIRLAVARHRSTTCELLSKLSMINYLPIQIAVAGHCNLSEATAGKLLKNHLRELRRVLAGNPKVPFFVMEKLARDFKDIRVRLAQNPNIPAKIMKRLAHQKDREVRTALAKNDNISTPILEKLSRDKDDGVRAAVALHFKIPHAGLRALAEDSSLKVRELVLERALEEYPTDKIIFRALTNIKPSLVAQRAQDHLDELEILEREAKAAAVSEQEEPPLE